MTANSCGWLNFFGLKRWEYGGSARQATRIAALATANGDLDVLLILDYITNQEPERKCFLY